MHSKLRNHFSNEAIDKNKPLESRKLDRAEYMQRVWSKDSDLKNEGFTLDAPIYNARSHNFPQK